MVKSNIKKEFNCGIEKIWNVITDNTNYTWRSDFYPTYFTITSKINLKEYKFNIENCNIKGRWIGLFKKLDNGNVLLDFTEEIETNNFIMKLLAKPYLKIQQKRYMRDLEKKLKEN